MEHVGDDTLLHRYLSLANRRISSQFIMDTLIEQFELREIGRIREVTNADNIFAILHHHWDLSEDYYPEERQRLRRVSMIIFCASNTARASTVVGSTRYLGRNGAVDYRDIQLYAVWDNEYPDGVNLGMLIQL
jgi:hypothetical protein